MNDDEINVNEETGEAVGSLNNERLKMFEQIADSADELRAGEMESIDAPEQLEEVREEVKESAPPEIQKYKIKVNGQEREVTLEEMQALAQKVAAADDYLAQSKRAFEESVRPSRQDAVQTPEVEEQDDLAIARALQMGSEEDAVAALRKLRSAPPVNVEAIVNKAKDQLRFETDANWFREEYKDVFADPYMAQLALSQDEKLVRNGDTRPYRERFKAIGDELRAWRGTNPGFSEKAQQKKEMAKPLPVASAKAMQPPPEEPDDDPRSVIAEMARRRGQSI